MGLAIIVPSISFEDANLGKVTLSGNVPIRGLYINLEDSYTGTKIDLKCSYLPANTTQRNVVWSIESGSEYASISGSVLTILNGANNNNVVVKCMSANNNSIFATKTISVTKEGQQPHVPLLYIAADGGKRIDTGITDDAEMSIEADFLIPEVTLADSDRQIVFHNNADGNILYSTRWGMLTLSFPGAQQKVIYNRPTNRLLAHLSLSEITLYDKVLDTYISLSNRDIMPNNHGEISLFMAQGLTFNPVKVLIYGFSIKKNNNDLINLSPVLLEGVPCFYDSTSNNYFYFSGESGNIYYATQADPNTEITYNE